MKSSRDDVAKRSAIEFQLFGRFRELANFFLTEPEFSTVMEPEVRLALLGAMKFAQQKRAERE
jgi:hypothetical protein